MGDTKLADIPGNAFHAGGAAQLASRASNASDSAIPIGIIRQATQLLSGDILPTASQPGSATNFADVGIINLGSDGNGTVVLASRTFSAAGTSVDALAPGALTIVGTPTVSAGEVIGVSYTSQGNGIALVAHGISLSYRLT